jgi:hypothetical protein
MACVAYYASGDTPECYLRGGKVVSGEGETGFRMSPSMEPEPRANELVVDWASAARVALRFMASELPEGEEWIKMYAD